MHSLNMNDTKDNKTHIEVYKHVPTLESAGHNEAEKIAVTKEKVLSDGSEAKTNPAEIALVRKLDRCFLPMLWFIYIMNYLDRNNIAQTRLNTLETDLNLTGSQYNTAVAILFVGYVSMQLPSNMLLSRVRPSRYIPACVILWSCISAATGAVQNFSGLVALRFLLGIAEAPFYPGALFLLSVWYKRNELALRMAILYMGLVLATAFSGLFAAAIFELDMVAGIPGWRWLFILEGSFSVLVGILAIFVLPDYPENTTWLTEAERKLASERLEADNVSDQESNNSLMFGVKQAVKDPRCVRSSVVEFWLMNNSSSSFNQVTLALT